MQVHSTTTPTASRLDSTRQVNTELGIFDANTFYRATSTRKAISRTADVVTGILTEGQISAQRRGLILALIGKSNGSTEPFKLSNFELGKLLYKFDGDASVEDQKKRRKDIERMVRRELKKLTQEQIASGLTLVSIKEGRQIQNGDQIDNIPNEFTLPILPLIQATLAQFKLQKGADRIRGAARLAIKESGAKLLLPPKTSNRREPDQLAIAHKQALTWAEKFAALSGDKMTALDKLIAELAELKQEGGRTRESGGLVAIQAELSVLPENSGVLYSYKSQGGDCTLREEEESSESVPLASTASLFLSEPIREAKETLIPPCDSDGLESEARRAFDTFLSVEAWPDETLFKNDETEEREAGQKITPTRFSEELENSIHDARQASLSFIARLRGPVLQLDDATQEEALYLRRFSFLEAETSKGNFQSWLAFADDEDKAAARERLFRRLRETFPGTKINAGSGGAIRWPGSINFKLGRDQWTVRLTHTDAGRIVTPAELDDAGLLAEQAAETDQATPSVCPSVKGWPSYEKTLERAVAAGKSQSEADASFVTSAILFFGKRNHDEIAAKLREVSPHARESEPEGYARRTVKEVATFLRTQKRVAWA